MSMTATLAPWRARRSAMAKPFPCAPPVTMATLPSRKGECPKLSMPLPLFGTTGIADAGAGRRGALQEPRAPRREMSDDRFSCGFAVAVSVRGDDGGVLGGDVGFLLDAAVEI